MKDLNLIYMMQSLGMKQDKNIQSGDVIQLKSTDNFIEVNGFVNRPKVYEYLDSENIKDLINFALGLKANVTGLTYQYQI